MTLRSNPSFHINIHKNTLGGLTLLVSVHCVISCEVKKGCGVKVWTFFCPFQVIHPRPRLQMMTGLIKGHKLPGENYYNLPQYEISDAGIQF